MHGKNAYLTCLYTKRLVRKKCGFSVSNLQYYIGSKTKKLDMCSQSYTILLDF